MTYEFNNMAAIKKVAVFGATGNLGLSVLQQVTAIGLQVTVLLRDPNKLPAEYNGKVKVIKGNILHADDVKETLTDAQGVIVVVGTRNNLDPTTELSEGLKNITAAMKLNNIRPISVCLSAFLFMPQDKVPPRFNDLNDEHGRMLKVLESTDLDYIAVFPPHIGENPRGVYSIKENTLPGGRVVAKPDLAHFMVSSLSDPEHYKKKIGISSVL